MFKQLSTKVKKAWAAIALLSVEMVLIVAVFLIALLTLAYLIRNVIVLHRTGFDQKVFSYLRSHISPANNDVMLFFTFLGTHRFLIPANLLLIAYFLFVQKRKWYAIQIPAIALSSLALMFGLKHLFNRSRPDVPLLFKAEGLSFPSGHALFSITFYGLLIYLVYRAAWPRWLKYAVIILLACLIVVIGFSRVYLRVHYASDVLAGFCVGFVWLVISLTLLTHLEKKTKKNAGTLLQSSS